jgi:hypothetical protein
VTSGDEQDEWLKHQMAFLTERELTSGAMDDWKRQLWLLERLAGGKHPTKLDPELRERLQGELEKATVSQLKTTGLMYEWLESWEARDKVAQSLASMPSAQERMPAHA